MKATLLAQALDLHTRTKAAFDAAEALDFLKCGKDCLELGCGKFPVVHAGASTKKITCRGGG